MATVIGRGWRRRATPLAPDRYERMLAAGAIVLLLAVAAALARGRGDWAQVPAIGWAHLATVVAALALTPVLLLRRRGNRRHRALGIVWVAAMLGTALLSFGIRVTNGGRFSAIHLLSLFVLAMAPVIWWSARTHRVALHRRSVRGMVTGALLAAGFFTFPFGRLLGRWLFA